MRADRGAQNHRQQRRRHSFAHHVGDGEQHAFAADRQHVEVIAADFVRGLRKTENAELVALGKIFRQQRLLDSGGDFQLPLGALLHLPLFLRKRHRPRDADKVRDRADELDFAGGEIGTGPLAHDGEDADRRVAKQDRADKRASVFAPERILRAQSGAVFDRVLLGFAEDLRLDRVILGAEKFGQTPSARRGSGTHQFQRPAAFAQPQPGVVTTDQF